MYVKLAGCILIVLATTGIGYGYGNDLKKHLEALRDLKRIMLMLSGEIKYTRSPLQEAFSHIGRRLTGQYASWLTMLSERLSERSGLSFYDLWELTMDQELKKTALHKQDLEQLKALGMNMGYLDQEMQLNTIGLYLEQLETEITRTQEEITGKRRLCHCLGVMSGIFIAVVLL